MKIKRILCLVLAISLFAFSCAHAEYGLLDWLSGVRPTSDSADVQQSDDPFVGQWYAIYIHTGVMDLVPNDYYLTINLFLNEDGTASFDYPEYEESTWGEDEDGILRYNATGAPLTLQEDGTLVMGSYLSGYTMFSKDPEAVATVFPEEEAEETPAGTEIAMDGDYIERKFTAYQYEVSGYTADAASLGAEYAVTLHQDNTATLVLAGAELAGLSWTETEEGITIDYYGVSQMDITFCEGEIVMNYMDTMLLYMR